MKRQKEPLPQAAYQSPEWVAALWGVNKDTIYRRLADKAHPIPTEVAFKCGRIWKVDPVGLRYYMQKNGGNNNAS